MEFKPHLTEFLLEWISVGNLQSEGSNESVLSPGLPILKTHWSAQNRMTYSVIAAVIKTGPGLD